MQIEGTVVLNYKLTRKLGKGGFGVVYLAEHVELGRLAACKILHPEFARRKDLVNRFFREARAACAIGHPAIIDVQNFGRLESGAPYFLMEYFAGVNLSARLKQDGPLRYSQLPALLSPIASALSAAHAAGIVHRDLKPGNIMIREVDGAITDVKLFDFGIAKLLDEGDTGESLTGAAIGTPAYMAPEQARDAKAVDERADVYAFAATVFAAITGRAPFVGRSPTDVLLQVQSQPAPRASKFARVPAGLDDAIDYCLSKRPSERPASMDEAWGFIRRALEEGEAEMAESGTTAPTRPPVDIVDTTLTKASGQRRSTPDAPRRRWVWAVAAVVLVAAAGVAVALFASGGEPQRARPVAGRAAGSADAAPSVVAPADAAAATDAASPPGDARLPDAATVTAKRPVKPKPRPRTRRRHRRRRRQPPVASAKPTTPALDCREQSFSAIYSAADPTAAQIRSALQRLKTCHRRGKLDTAVYKRIQTALVARF